MIEQCSVNHNIYVVLHLSKGMIVIVNIHFHSFPKCLDKSDVFDQNQFFMLPSVSGKTRILDSGELLGHFCLLK